MGTILGGAASALILSIFVVNPLAAIVIGGVASYTGSTLATAIYTGDGNIGGFLQGVVAGRDPLSSRRHQENNPNTAPS